MQHILNGSLDIYAEMQPAHTHFISDSLQYGCLTSIKSKKKKEV